MAEEQTDIHAVKTIVAKFTRAKEPIYQCSYSAGMYPHEHPYSNQLVN